MWFFNNSVIIYNPEVRFSIVYIAGNLIKMGCPYSFIMLKFEQRILYHQTRGSFEPTRAKKHLPFRITFEIWNNTLRMGW